MLSQQGVTPQIVEVDDFSGGMTDNILGAPKNKFQKADNFFLQKVGDKARLITRPAMRNYTSARIGTSSRINHAFDIETKTFQISNKKLYQNDTSSFTEITGPTNSAFNLGDTASKYAVSIWQKHALIANDAFAQIVKLYNNGTSWTVNNLGVPALSGNPTMLASGIGTTFSYGYAFHYYTTYPNQGVTFAEQGNIKYVAATSNVALGGANTMTITPPGTWTITNGATDNYLFANLKVRIWRTTNGGTSYYFLTEQNYNFASYVDSTADTTINLSSNTVLYTNGADGVPAHEQPPASKLAHVVNDILCLGYVTESGVQIPTRARFSNRFSPWSCPATFYENFDEEIVGINSFNIYPIYFCKNKIYRIEGFYLPDGSGGITKKLISSTAGCLSNRSIIRTDIGLFWAGNDGFYYTDGYNVQRISNDLLTSYLTLTNSATKKAAITGAYYPKLQAVMWTVQDSASSTDNDKLYLTYLQAPVSDSMPFTTWSGGDVRSNFLPTAIHHTNGVLYMGDTNGYWYKFDHDLFSDSRVEVGVSVSSWINKAIFYDYRSVSFDFGLSSLKKWIARMVMLFENTSSVSLQIYSNNDNSGNLKALKAVDSRGDIAWGDYAVKWGDDIVWNNKPIVAVKRMFPKAGLRAFYKQVVFQNSYASIETSTTLGQATFSGVANTATLGGANLWPTDILDYYISTSADNYSNQFKISSLAQPTITLVDTDNVLPTGLYSWKIQGYRRDEIVRIVSYAIDYSPTSQSASVYRG
jgi:hypothetical protein